MKRIVFLLAFVFMWLPPSLAGVELKESCRVYFAIQNSKVSTQIHRVTSFNALNTLSKIAFVRLKFVGESYEKRHRTTSKVRRYTMTVDPVSAHRLKGATFLFDLGWRNLTSHGSAPAVWRLKDHGNLYLEPKPGMNRDKIELQRVAYQPLRRGVRYEILSGEVTLANFTRQRIVLKLIQKNMYSETKIRGDWQYSGPGVFLLTPLP